MNLEEIKAAVRAGKTVHWMNASYRVVSPSPAEWLIAYTPEKENFTGLTHRDGVTLNGAEDQFYIAEEPEDTNAILDQTQPEKNTNTMNEPRSDAFYEDSIAETYRKFYPVVAPLIMGSGVGDGRTTMCVVAQAACIDALRKGHTLDEPTDQMECACPTLRRLAIRLNDGDWWKDDMERTEVLRPLIPMLLDSKQLRDVTLKRIYHVADNSVRVLTPMRLRFRAEHTRNEKQKQFLIDGVTKLEAIPAIVDNASAIAARDICRELRTAADAAAYAYAAAAAAAYAYAAAYADAAAAAAAYADTYAYAYAAAYADAYADAYAAAYAQRVKYRDALLTLFREVVEIVE